MELSRIDFNDNIKNLYSILFILNSKILTFATQTALSPRLWRGGKSGHHREA